MKIVSLDSIDPQLNPPIEYECKESIYILFNPWLKDDPVYMEDENLRNEYVLNDVGKLYVGNYWQPRSRSWVYGQFADVSLPASVFLLEKTDLDYYGRSNPILVCRAISALVNSNDGDEGIVAGRWEGPYSDGTAPWTWTGSTSILEQYLNSGGQPVKYGQCWVFGGVCTSVCRALGIPTRNISNFASAHDTDNSLTIDKIFDKDGNELSFLSYDSIWNYHVWNECWMTRPDLPVGYGGWQVVDATPQERSDGIFRSGPSSVIAVRQGEIYHGYDTPFVFSEVNADIIHWLVDLNGSVLFTKIRTNKYHVGRLIVTKKVGVFDEFGNDDMEEVTDQYKNKEGSREERIAIVSAARHTLRSREYFNIPDEGDVSFELEDITSVKIGQPFRVSVRVENQSDAIRTVSAAMTISSIYYTGVAGNKIKGGSGDFTLQPHQKEVLAINITADEYLDKLVEYCMIKIYALAKVDETNHAWSEEDDFVVEKPDLKLETQGEMKVGQPFTLEIHFTNPLQRVLRNCVFTIEGPGISDPHKADFRDIAPEESVVYTETFTPRKPGPKTIVAVFSSNELVDITGSKKVDISE